MENGLLKHMEEIFKSFSKYWHNDSLIRDKIINDLRNDDVELLSFLLKDNKVSDHFVKDIKGYKLFDKESFISMLRYKNYWQDSYTKYANKIGLTSDGKYLNYNSDVVLDFPFKDCVLEGGMTKEDSILKNDEKFYNNIIAKEEIDTLFSPKTFTNVVKYDENGEHKVIEIKDNDNLMVKGNNLIALHSLKKRYAGKVKLIYIDPPFNTGGDGFKYNDRFNQSTWLTFMKNRLEIAKEMLTNDGNIIIHLDWNESHYLKVVADSIFGKENFLNEIIWSYDKWTASSKNLQKNHDVLLVYSLNKGNHQFNIIKELTDNLKEKYKKGYLFGGGGGSQGLVVYDENNKKAKELIASGKYDVVYAKAEGKPLSDVWNIPFINPVSKERTGFNSQKPEKLMMRILSIFTNEQDLILDYHSGSSTTQAVAHKMNRQYIGIEQMNYINTVSVPRLQKVIEGEQGGISKDIEWQGGGSFVYAELAKENQEIIDEIINIGTKDSLNRQIEALLQKGVLNYEIDFNVFTTSKKDFEKLTLEDQKEVLIKSLDNNQLYVNYFDIEDTHYNFSEEDKKFNESFYKEV
ncbi:DNA methyltransferase [Staphylococcus casei]|uniref:DNA methyltransferase n=1 Tax=Staphylococcus casei TaxID=201828 RepID=UPI003D9A3DCC